MSNWQPIETAPTKSRVLLAKDGKVYAGTWAKNMLTGDIGWVIGELGDGQRAVLTAPTHWMPAPEAPEP